MAAVDFFGAMLYVITMKYSIEKFGLRVEADCVGAELTSVKVDGKEMLWQNDNGGWSGHAPILFPVCGNCSVVSDGKNYGMSPHGFAKCSTFVLVDRGDDFLRFELKSDASTRKYYPFDFILSTEYRIASETSAARTLEIKFELYNSDEKSLYFAYGGHESFALDKDLDRYKLMFETDEDLIHLCHDGLGRLTGEKVRFGVRRELNLPERYLSEGKTLIFSGIKSSSVALATEDGKPIARSVFGNFDNPLLWRPDGARMICIEPWSNLPDGYSDESKEFSIKHGVFAVDPRSKAEIVRSIEYYK